MPVPSFPPVRSVFGTACAAGFVMVMASAAPASAQSDPRIPYPARSAPTGYDSGYPVSNAAAAETPPGSAYAYDAANRAAERERWLDECRTHHSDKRYAIGIKSKKARKAHAQALCEDYLTRYAAAYTMPPSGMPVSGSSGTGSYPYYYPVPGGYPVYGHPAQAGSTAPTPSAGASQSGPTGTQYGPVMLVPRWVPVDPRTGKPLDDHRTP